MQTDDTHLATEHILALRNYPRKPAYLLAALEDVFCHFGSIPEASKKVIRDYFHSTAWPDALADGLFHTTKDSLKSITVCEGPCCRQAGSDQLAGLLASELHTTIERSHCMGNCQKAPAAKVNGEVVVEASLVKIRALL